MGTGFCLCKHLENWNLTRGRPGARPGARPFLSLHWLTLPPSFQDLTGPSLFRGWWRLGRQQAAGSSLVETLSGDRALPSSKPECLPPLNQISLSNPGKHSSAMLPRRKHFINMFCVSSTLTNICTLDHMSSLKTSKGPWRWEIHFDVFGVKWVRHIGI